VSAKVRNQVKLDKFNFIISINDNFSFVAIPGLKNLSLSSVAQKQQELLKQATEQQFVPKEPPPDFEFVADPPSISALDLDIVKLTAQFVARNGRQFLTNLMNREQRNFQFDFLRPQHSLFQYFTKLLEQYTKILIPPKELLPKLRTEIDSSTDGAKLILDQVKYRANWLKHEEAQKRREEEKIERERVAYAQIDWHDFVVVEVVEYQPFETGNFPAPTTPDEIGARVIMEQRYQEDDNDIEMQIESDEEPSSSANDQQVPHHNIKLSIMENRIKDNVQVQDMDEESSDDEQASNSKQPTVAPILPPTHDKVIVKKYDPKQVQKVVKPVPSSDEYLISPITGEKIPASKVAEHMRIGLLDPRWVEQRDKLIEKVREENVYAPGAAIEASLKQLAERRTDIFGVGDEEAAIGKKLGEEETRKDDRVTWDGHTSSVEAATRAAARNVSLEDQIHQIHKVKGLLPDEEKEKIGPKPIGSNQGSTLTAPPKPSSHPQMMQHQMNIGSNIAHHSAPPMPSVPPPVLMMPQMRPQMRPPPLIPPPVGFPVGFPNVPGMVPPAHLAPAPPIMEMNDEEPPNKKSRQEDNLIPEDVFMQHHSVSYIIIFMKI
jgi:splicing factor 3A subunit 1